MTNRFMDSRMHIETRFAAWWIGLQAKADGLLVHVEGDRKSDNSGLIAGLSIGAIIAIIAVALLCLIPICVIVVLTLMGPAIGNVFSNIIENLPSPTP